MSEKNKTALEALKKAPKKAPTFKQAQKREKRVIVYVTESENELLREVASTKGFRSLSAYMLHLALYADSV